MRRSWRTSASSTRRPAQREHRDDPLEGSYLPVFRGGDGQIGSARARIKVFASFDDGARPPQSRVNANDFGGRDIRDPKLVEMNGKPSRTMRPGPHYRDVGGQA
jgi:hypothetical protein